MRDLRVFHRLASQRLLHATKFYQEKNPSKQADWLFSAFKNERRFCSSEEKVKLKFCVVGSGPAGFYTADKLLTKLGDKFEASVDIVDRLPTPFGLVRSGVAPDHPDTKVVVNRFGQILQHPNCNFFGNVTIGRDVSLKQLRDLYHGVVLAYGAEDDRHLNVPGEELTGVVAAREAVWWYNGHPDYAHFDQINLSSTKSVVIVGLGNVALDCARVLLQDPDGRLKTTDIAQHALHALRHSAVERVVMVGRRGPAQAAFTPKELREMLSFDDVKVVLRESDMVLSAEDEEALKKGDRRARRVYEVLSKAAAEESQTPEVEVGAGEAKKKKELHIVFFRNPAEVIPSGANSKTVGAVKFEKTKVEGGRAVGTGEFEDFEADLVLRSIGYKGRPVEGCGFHERSGTVPNSAGRALTVGIPTGTTEGNPDGERDLNTDPGLYVCGWLKRGPSGIIGSNLNCAEETVGCIREDMQSGKVFDTSLDKPGTTGLQELLGAREVDFVSVERWNKINEVEVQRGEAVGKPREKITSLKECLDVSA